MAVYKKFRYYPLLYIFVGGFFRLIKKYKFGDKLLEIFFVKFHYLFYVLFKKQRLSQIEVRNIFYDYFITPIATFQSKSDVNKWCLNTNSRIIKYDRTSGNCHVFLIKKMIKKPKISIITVSYNSGSTIKQTIKSVIDQDYENIEYIIIDGNSSDNTLNVIRQYSEFIHFFISEEDNGIYDAMNKGIANASGDIIGILNSDDFIPIVLL